MNRLFFSAIIALLFISAACSSHKPPVTVNAPTMTADELLAVSKESALRAQNAKSSNEQENWALHGISVAEQCLMRSPEEAGCYYYRAVNTGLYHEVHIIGYQKGVKRMIEDCQAVIKYEPEYDHGGAYRILGQLYTKLPQTAGRPDSVTRDLDKAETYLKKASRVDPDYPENQLFLAETLLAKEKFNEALDALTTAKELTPLWRDDNSYTSWQISLTKLEKKINRAAK